MNSESLLILASIALVIIFSLIRFRKMVRIHLIRLIYGKYSLEYDKHFKRIFIRSPFQHCFREEFIQRVYFILDQKGKTTRYKSEAEITFENLPFKADFKKFITERGEPDCYNIFSFQKPSFIIKAAGYHQEVSGVKALVVYYFMDDSFFMGEYTFRNSFPKVKNTFIKHFFPLNGIQVDNFYVENDSKIIHFKDSGFSIDIRYLDKEDTHVIHNLKSYYDQIKKKKLILEN